MDGIDDGASVLQLEAGTHTVSAQKVAGLATMSDIMHKLTFKSKTQLVPEYDVFVNRTPLHAC